MLYSALESLNCELQHLCDDARLQSPRQLARSLQLADDFDAIEWLAAQPVFPKFYWQSRDGAEEIVALGALAKYTSPEQAQAALIAPQRIWGGLPFDAHENAQQGFFFLPAVELCRFGESWQLLVNLNEQPALSLELLSQLNDRRELMPLRAKRVAMSHAPQQPQWQAQVTQALDAIAQGSLAKVVLARKTQVQLSEPVRPAQIIQASRRANPNSIHFMLALDLSHGFIGSTPERLFMRRDHTLYTEALAGTIGRGDNAEQDSELASWLLNDAKNIYENQLVVDDIAASLEDAVDEFHVASSPSLVRLAKVQHLKRPITAQCHANICDANLLSRLHPTAAVAGLPRAQAKAFIAEHEPFTRGWYSGAVGYLSAARSEFCVAIRSAQICDNTVELYAGAGIVPGSDADSEWQELERKTATLLRLFADASVSKE
ncbi:Isochorismate synthase MenF [Vibrio stylophorae]|uniref:Isochorismate synthase MenF n=1 Tax=Vibrio stylophorae TaxID=659351 RepID=A0ABM8ZU50_9VIBR|nr:isochorismate synthase [Vibrio stylophorae]CAH0533844.1 Isochorismate synthase MenF [Vibrio stylophorae]